MRSLSCCEFGFRTSANTYSVSLPRSTASPIAFDHFFSIIYSILFPDSILEYTSPFSISDPFASLLPSQTHFTYTLLFFFNSSSSAPLAAPSLLYLPFSSLPNLQISIVLASVPLNLFPIPPNNLPNPMSPRSDSGRSATTQQRSQPSRSTSQPYPPSSSSRRPSSHAQPKSTRQQFSACGACRMRRYVNA